MIDTNRYMARWDNRGANTRSTKSMLRPFKCKKCGKSYAVEWAKNVHEKLCLGR